MERNAWPQPLASIRPQKLAAKELMTALSHTLAHWITKWTALTFSHRPLA